MSDKKRRRPSSKSTRAAIDWLIRITELASKSQNATTARQGLQGELKRWATRSPGNLRSFLKIASLFVAVGECETELTCRENKERLKTLRGTAVAVLATLVLLTAGVLIWHWTEGTIYRTSPGEWRRIRLEDGSVAFATEQSQFRVSFSATYRRITLTHGRVIFDVAKDPRRPFFVITDNAEIKALGTRFDVELHDGPTRVTVIDGSVRVGTTSTEFERGHTRTLNAQEGAEVSGQEIVELDRSQVESTIASQRDVLVFEHQSLAVAASRINLSCRRQLRFVDAAAGQKPISGRYMTDHPEGLVRAIQDLYPELVVRETDDGWLVSQPAPNRP